MDFDTRPAAYCVVTRTGEHDAREILLSYWKVEGHEGWTLPGGGLDAGESPAEAAVREVREETGYDVRLTELLGVDARTISAAERLHPHGDRSLMGLRVVYAAEVTGGELTFEVDGSTTHAAWLPLTQVAHLDRVGLVDVGLRLWRERPALGAV